MAAQRVPCTGGPLDGMAVRVVSGQWAWIDRKGRVSATPVDRRALYRRERDGDGILRYVYAGHRWTYCSGPAGCGGYHGRAEGGRETAPCPLQTPALADTSRA